MSEKEKIVLLTDILSTHKSAFEFVLESDMADYRKCLELFLMSSDPIIQEGALATCQLIIQRIKS